MGEDGYSRNHAFVNRRPIDNRWVAPYNPYLTRRHINVDLYKYIFKGTDRSTMQVDFIPIQRLALDLPDEQPVYFDEDASPDWAFSTKEIQIPRL